MSQIVLDLDNPRLVLADLTAAIEATGNGLVSKRLRALRAQIWAMSLMQPCVRCGWQYDAETLAAARRGEVKLDPTPTHLCRGGA